MDANIQKYQAFVEVADAGSFTKAAETLAYSQSGISHMVSDLERDWGVALFERSRRGVVLTGDGARLLPEARALCESFRALEATVDEVRGLETGLIRIGVFPSVAAHWIPRIIKRFNADYTGIAYKLRVSDYTEIEEWIAAGTVDCGFVMLPLRTDARLVVRALEEDEFLEYAEYVGNFYGTPKKYVDRAMDDGRDVILDIEIQGANQICAKRPETVRIFIAPPSWVELERRLTARGTDSQEVIQSRLLRAKVELQTASSYDYLVINDTVEQAVTELAAILCAEHCRPAERLEQLLHK